MIYLSKENGRVEKGTPLVHTCPRCPRFTPRFLLRHPRKLLSSPITKDDPMFTTVSILLAALCLLPSAAKLSAQPAMQASAEHFGVEWPRYRLIGVAELAAGFGILAGLAWPPIGVAAAAGMAVLLAGALVMHARAGDSAKEMAPALVILLVTIGYLAVALPR
ncbi:MAG: DoxX family protein [Candidatus Limnocylindrales bacterium]